jgi:hypothetical protein
MRRQANRRAHVVGEDQERAAVRNHAAVERHAVHDAAHRVLANSKMDVSSARRLGREERCALHRGERRSGEVGGSTDELRHLRREGVDHRTGCRAARDVAIGRVEHRDGTLPPRREIAVQAAPEFLRVIGERLRVRDELTAPRLLRVLTGFAHLAPVRKRRIGHEERILAWPAEFLLGEQHLVLAEWFAVRLRRVDPVRASVSDVRARHDERRPVGLGLRQVDRAIDGVEIVHVGDVLHMPAVCLEPFRGVIAARDVGATVDRDVVAVEEPDELAELLVSGERGGLVRDPFHQVAVACDEPGMMVDDRVSIAIERRGEMALGERHADRVGQSLAERARCGLHARGVSHFRMAGRLASPLTELLDVVERQIVPAQEERRVEQHRRVAAGEYDPIAIGPMRIGGIVPNVAVVERVCERRERHRCARVPRFRLLHRVHREGANGVDGEQL